MSDTAFTTASNSPPELTAENEGAIQYLLFALDGREYGLRLDSLQEVLRYNSTTVAPVPNTPEWLEGIFSLRGTIISVVNLRSFLGMPPAEQSDALSGQLELFGIGAAVPRLLVLHSGEVVVGVVVDDIRGVLFVNPEEMLSDVVSSNSLAPYLEGSHLNPKDGKQTWLFDTARLLNSPEMLAFEPQFL